MRPCPTGVSGELRRSTRRASATARTASSHCATDFAGNGACTPDQHRLRSTTTRRRTRAASPSPAARAGGAANDFDLAWVNPDQGVASPIGGAFWRIEGPAGYDTGVKFVAGHEPERARRTSSCRGPGIYSLQRLAARRGRQRGSGFGGSMPLRFDDVPPGVAFDAPTRRATRVPEQIRAADHRRALGPGRRRDPLPAARQPSSGPSCRRSSSAARRPTRPQLVARLPGDLGPGTYVFRADAATAPATPRSTHPPRRRHRDDRAQGRRGGGRGGQAGRAGAAPRPGRRRGSSPSCAGAGAAAPS